MHRNPVRAVSGLGALLALVFSATASAAESPSAPLRAEGSEWVLQTDTGTLRSADLVGAQLRLAGGAVLRIDAVRQESEGGRSFWTHEMSALTPQGWQPLCAPHSDGTHDAVVLPGREQADASLVPDPAKFALSCTSGALAKCLRMGYAPWMAASGGGSLLSPFNACVRMVRADYGGDGQPFTENGRQIDVYDDLGVQRADMSASQAFEAGWSEHGAVCIHHLRVAGKLSQAELEARFPQLRGRLGEACTESFARSHGALVFNRSNPTPGL